MNAGEVRKLLLTKYAPPSWALLQEVRDGTGYSTAGRLMDAMAFGLWPSRGLEIHGFEIKVSRGDWLRELKQPEKAESFYKFVDRWWIVAPEYVVAKPEELPKTWGFMLAKGGKLKTIVEATAKKATPINRLFMMAIIRRVSEAYVSKGSFDELVAEKVAAKVDSAVSHATFGRDQLQREVKELEERIRTFEEKSGVKIDRWNAEPVGEAVRIVTKYGPKAILAQYKYLGERMTELGGELSRIKDEAQTALEGLTVDA